MANIEEKKLVRAKENAASVDKALTRLKGYGWQVVGKSQRDAENNNIEYITLQRDLSIPENAKFKEIEDEEDEVKRAEEYCNSYKLFLESKIEEIDHDRGYRKGFLVFLIIYGLFQIVGGTFFAIFLKPMMESGFIQNQGEGTVSTETMMYTLPEGVKIFGMHEFDIMTLILVVCYAVGGLMLIIAAIILISKKAQRKILLEHRDAYKARRDDFVLLINNLKKWTPSSLGKFDPYAKGEFKSLKK